MIVNESPLILTPEIRFIRYLCDFIQFKMVTYQTIACLKSTIETLKHVVLLSLLLTLNIFRTFF